MKEYSSPKYLQIKNHIIKEIADGKISASSKLPSENEYAQIFDVNRLTVRKAYQELITDGILYAIQGKGTYVSEANLTDESHSFPSTSRRKIIGVIFPETSVFFGTIFNMLEKCATENGYMLNVMLNNTPEREGVAIDTMINNHVDGIIITPQRTQNDIDIEHYNRLLNSGIPVVIYGKPPAGIVCDAVYTDDVLASYNATRHLIARNHSKILYLCNHTEDTVAFEERQAGYQKAVTEYLGNDALHILDICTPHCLEDIVNCIIKGEYTAIYTDQEDFIFNLYHSFTAKGIALPTNFEIICYIGTDIIQRTKLPVSIVEIPKIGMAMRAFEMIANKMQNPDPQEYTNASIFHPALYPYSSHK